jgi:hypothetical protein
MIINLPVRGRLQPLMNIAVLIIEAIFILAIMLETGTLETGLDSKFRRPIQILATILCIIYIGMCGLSQFLH